MRLKKFLTIKQSSKSEGEELEKLGSLVARLAEELEHQKAVTGENVTIQRDFEKRVAELNDEVTVPRRLMVSRSQRLIRA